MIALFKSTRSPNLKAVPILYLDLDGTVREGKDDPLGKFVNGPEDVRVFSEAIDMMRSWKNRGGKIVGISNQGGISLGLVSLDRVREAMMETQHQCDGLFDTIQICPHFPDSQEPELARCWCRKPAPGMIIEAALDLGRQFQEYYPPHMALFVGDRQEDLQCAEIANIDFQWAKDWRALAAKL